MPLLVRLHLPPRALCFRDLPIYHRVRLCHEYGAPGAKLAVRARIAVNYVLALVLADRPQRPDIVV
eukprot:9594185-Prorocentrum_lima.AAC.1